MSKDTRIKTDFFDQQARESSTGLLKNTPLRIVLGLVAVGVIWALYTLVQYVLNFNKLQAMKNVTVTLQKPDMRDGVAMVDVTLGNLNPLSVEQLVIRYGILGPEGNVVSSNLVLIPNTVPAGGERTFRHVKLGEFKDQSARMQAELADLKLGPKANLNPEQEMRFTELAGLKEEQEAEKGFEEFVKAAPEFVPGYVALGRAYMNVNNYDKALEVLKQAVHIDEHNAEAHYQLALALRHKGATKEAEREMQAAYDLMPNDPDIQQTISEMRQ